MSVSFLVFFTGNMYVGTFNFGNFNPSEMSKMFLFIKNAFLFVLFTMIVKPYIFFDFVFWNDFSV